jgi:two-component system osmolarity sensor histidine kinase EnvZ
VLQRVRVASTAGEVSLEVEDAGDGIAPALREQVLDAFVRGDGSRAAPGTGLGLAIVRQVAARLGGTVTIGGEAGRHWVRVTVPRRG